VYVEYKVGPAIGTSIFALDIPSICLSKKNTHTHKTWLYYLLKQPIVLRLQIHNENKFSVLRNFTTRQKKV